MHENHERPSELRSSSQDGLQIKLWEFYLIRCRSDLYHLLSSHSLDKGPVQKNRFDPDRVSFRFLAYDWEKTVKQLLASNNMPYEIDRKFKVDILKPAKKKVFLADDDPDILFTLNYVLKDAGYEVLLSDCGRPLLEPNLPAIDLFVLDKIMPDVDGLEICRALRGRSGTRHIPVIMISASWNGRAQALISGCSEYIRKPFDVWALLQLVDKFTTTAIDSLSPLQIVR
jgi:CheY-like chemotaxis protein